MKKLIGLAVIGLVLSTPALAVDAPKPTETELRLELRALNAEMQVMQGAYVEKTRRVKEIADALKAMAMDEAKKAEAGKAKTERKP